MRISHRKKKEEPKKLYYFNEGITVPEVFVLGTEGESLGVQKTGEAIRMARAQELDLVEINPKASPPVARIMDYGQFRYQQEKEMRIRKAHQHVVKTKGVRLSLRIGINDREIRKNQTLKFLDEGQKVKVEVFLRGRENQQWQMAVEQVKAFVSEIGKVVNIRVEQGAEKQGNLVTSIITKA